MSDFLGFLLKYMSGFFCLDKKNTVRQKKHSLGAPPKIRKSQRILENPGKFPEFSEISGDSPGIFRKFPEFSGIFRKFPENFRKFHEFPSIFRKFPKFHVLTHGSWNSFKKRGVVSCERMKDCDTDSSQFNFPDGLRKSN